MRNALLLLVPFVLVVAACGDSDESGGGSAESWCPLATDFEAIGDDLDALGPGDPDALRDAFNRGSALLEQAEGAAPAEISDDVSTFVAAFGELDSALRDADFDLFDVDLSALEEAGERVDSSQDAIDAYNERECGIEADSDDDTDGSDDGDESDDSDDGGFDPSAGSLREQLVTTFVDQGFSQDEAECSAEGVDPAVLAEGDESAILGVFDQCGIDLSRIAELAG